MGRVPGPGRGADGADIDRRARESYATDALSLGLIPRDLAEALMATSLIGHDAAP